jgi:hypothetical protein
MPNHIFPFFMYEESYEASQAKINNVNKPFFIPKLMG